MAVGVVGLLAGIVSVLVLPVMPSPFIGPIVVAAGIVAWVAKRRLVASLLLGAGLALLEAGAALDSRLDASRSGLDLVVEGRVEKVLSRRVERVSFVLAIDARDCPAGVPPRVRLAWYGPSTSPAAGETWRLRVRLREPHGTANPGGFDYERWLLASGIGAVGYVRRDEVNARLDPVDDWRNLVRQRLADSIAAAVRSERAGAVLTALVTGQRVGLTTEVRERMLLSGTAHLLAVSGLHVGIVAGTGAALGRVVWVVLPGVVAGTAIGSASVLSVTAAFIYAAIAGLSTATQRALVMVVTVITWAVARRSAPLAGGLVMAAFVILVTDPLAPLDGGFWLSFVAVGILALRFAGQTRAGSKLATLVSAQIALCIGMLVPAVTLFGFVPTIGPLVNLFAVPLVTLVVLPLGLLGGLWSLAAPGAPQWLLVVSGAALDRLFDVVEWVLAVGPGPIEAASSPIPVMAAAVLAGSVLLLSSAIPGRRIAPALLLPVLFWQGPTPGEGEFDMTVLDVGQGLSVVVRTRRHALVYDTGAAWPGGDAGAATVRPFLRWTGVNGIDRLMISHGDLDHAGGGASLAPLTSAPVLVGPGTEWLYGPVTVCRDGDAWTWDGVEFRVLHPAVDSGFTGNNASCVLQVSSVAGSALITGDIESVAEKRLARRHPRIRADVVVAPHHGSATSSSIDLVGITRPRWVVFSAGYRNRWGFPRDEVTARWGSAGAITLQTASTGALTFRFERGGIRREPTRWRCISRHIWRAVDCAGG